MQLLERERLLVLAELQPDEASILSFDFSRFPAIADPAICGTKLPQLVERFHGAIPGGKTRPLC